ncbi:uncharacterized protein EI90DRAFT_3047295 [Cantharellus anzutake]|uniref:uncharacterized protein n=1 Tax=Cantharellus anzutake TaxID=1750568 RepID=UPI0019045ED8|nr:uncharacterized protein EI90DRAFT_3047295 [Cantharellus anzutake]KAF8335843.1 hypothetical protein EI90DRAFT_3047295 [Cantharellus anzutake]
MLSGEEEALLSGDPHTLQAKVRFRKPPTLMDLQVLLTVIGEESAEYDLFRENCYFFCSVVHQILYELHEGHMTVGEFHHQTLGGDARKRIVNRLRQQSYVIPFTCFLLLLSAPITLRRSCPCGSCDEPRARKWNSGVRTPTFSH